MDPRAEPPITTGMAARVLALTALCPFLAVLAITLIARSLP